MHWISLSLLLVIPSVVAAKNIRYQGEDVAVEDVETGKTEVVVNNLTNSNDSYWTPENLAKVKPYPLPSVQPTARPVHHSRYKYDSVAANSTANTSATGKTGPKRRRRADDIWTPDDVASAKPAPLPSLSDEDLAKLGIKPQIKLKSVRTQIQTQKVEIASVNDDLFKPMGKLLFVDNLGDHYQCSGQYVAPNIVMTAGHCVYSVDTAGWNTQFKFIQNYVGSQPDTSFRSIFLGKKKANAGTSRRVTKAIVGKKWFAAGKENFAYDFAFLAMKDPSVGGYYDIDYPENYDQWVNAGYPSNFDAGQILRKYNGKKGTLTEDVVETPGNPMGPGCSGGAWIAQKDSKKYVVGVNSFSIVGRESMFSPHLIPTRVNAVLDKVKEVLQQA